MVVMVDFVHPTATMLDNNSSRRTFDQALKSKYVEQEELDNRLVVPKDMKISTDITFVGFGKVTIIQKQLNQLTSIDLSGKSIKSAGNLEDLKGSLNRVQVLNLANNSLTWHELNQLLPCLPNLKELILTNNTLNLDPNILDLSSQPARTLYSLTLGRVNLDWSSTIRKLTKLWNRIDQIDLWDNKLSSETMCLNDCTPELISFINQIRVLKLSHNYLIDLSWISDIGPIEQLIELDLSNCQLSFIGIDAAKPLRNLQILNVSYNNIADWKSISNLNLLSNLKTLICHENPIFISEKFARSFTIGRLGRIKVLNREEITRTVRMDSEIFYLRKIFPEYQSFLKGECREFKSLHPRYEELANYYGLPEDLTKKQAIDKYITVDLCYNDRKITKKLPCDMKIANVQMLCKRLFNLKPSNVIQITCCDSATSNNTMSYILDKEGQTLHFFSVGNGQKLVIKDLF